MRKEDVKELIKGILRKDLMAEALNIVENLNQDELNKFGDIIEKYEGDSQGNIVCIELDFAKTRLEYFNRIPKIESELGLDLRWIPDLVEKWQKEFDNTNKK